MSGRLDEIDLPSLKERQQSCQSSLDDYATNDTTYVAVVSLPTGNIENIADEVCPELGMPQWALKKFLAVRSGYAGNSAIDDAHNTAYEELSLSSIYKKHLSDSDVSNEIDDIVERVLSGENITLVCYEEDGDKCHRHILKDVIESRIDNRESCKFTLSA